MTDASKRIADLSPEGLAAFAKRLAGKKEAKKPELVPVARDRREFPLSFAQQRLWFVHQLDPRSAAYNLANFLRLEGAPNFAALHQALRAVVRRHEILRTTYAERQGTPVQIIHQELPSEIPIFDFSAVSEEHLESEGIRLLRLEMTRPFDLSQGPMLRCLVILWRDRFYWGFGYHHIVSDWWSSDIFFREVLHLYDHFSGKDCAPLPEVSLQYVDYAVWQRRKLDERTLARHIEFWRQKLGPRPPVLQLPTDRPRPAVPSGKGRKVRRTLPSEVITDLSSWSRKEGATLFMVLLAAFKVLLERSTGQQEISVGSASANRDHPAIQRVLGFFVNTLVFTTNLSGLPTFRQLLGRVKTSCLETFAHQDLPFEKLVAALQPEREANRNPLFQVMFSLETHAESLLEISSHGNKEQMLETVNTKFDLTVIVVEQPDRTSIDFEYSLDLFDATTITRMANQLRRLLRGLTRAPDRKISHLPLLDPAEHHQLLLGWNDTAADISSSLGLHQVFGDRATATPGALALVEAGSMPSALSSGELKRCGHRLAHYMQRRGVVPGDLVGLAMERSAETLVAILAILEAGAAFVPLDPSLPTERLTLMAQGISLVLTHRGLAPPLPSVERLIDVEKEAKAIARESATALDLEHFPGAPAYILFTSGSTGRPKGVVVDHRSVLRLAFEARFAPVHPDDALLQLAPLSFDASTFEIWASLLHGAVLVLPPPASPTLEELGSTLRRHRITTLWLTAGLFHLMIDERLSDLSGVRQLLAGGDVLSPSHIERLLAAHPQCTVINGYGPTENTTFTACHRMMVQPAASDPGTNTAINLSTKGAVPIGRPIDGTRIYVVSAADEMVSIGVPGELLAGGVGLASHYHRAPALTAERFVPDPLSGEPGARLYRTGDRVRWLPEGRVAFLGRLDDQVKIRGFRVEPRETELALCRHRALQDAVVVALPDATGGKRLVAYLQPAEKQDIVLDDVRQHLAQTLPDYLHPAAYVLLKTFPLNSNGKVDRRALPAPEPADLGKAADEAPRNSVETFLVSLWERLLGIKGVGIHQDFFTLGGHSLLATQAVSRIRGELGRELTLHEFFEHATPAQLAARLGGADIAGAALPPLVPLEHPGPVPLSFAQQRLWFLYQLEPESAAYNMADSLVFTEDLDPEALQRALDALVARHGSLRTRFLTLSGQPFQVVDDELQVVIARHDVRAQSLAEQEAAVRTLLNGEARRPFDLGQGPLLRVLLVEVGGAEQGPRAVLFFTMHHIVSDGWSLGIFVREFTSLYEALMNDLPSPLEALPIQYVDYAQWQRSWLRGEVLAQQLAYWKKHLRNLPQVQLPSDRPRPPLQSFAGATHTRRLPRALALDLDELSGRQGVTLFMTLLAGFGTLLSRYSGQDDIVLGSPIANRTRTETENLIGFFVNTLVLRLDLTGRVHSETLLQRVRELTLGAYDHQDLPFETLVDELKVPRDLSRNPLFQILFDFHTEAQDVPPLPTAGDGTTGDGTTGDRPPSHLGEIEVDNAICDLSLSVFAAGDQVLLGAQYSTALFDSSTIDRLLRHFENLLTAAAQAPSAEIHRLPMLSPAEVWQGLGEWNAHATDKMARQPPVTEGLESQARATPDAVAVAAEDGVLSYRELFRRTHRLAHRLRASGVERETRVGLLLGRSSEMIIAVLAVLKAGGAYVPLDPEDPVERLRGMVEDAAPRVLLVDRQTRAAAAAWAHGPPLELLELPLTGTPRDTPPAVSILPDQLAFCIYTSGSTGQPKGVLVSHRALSSYTTAARQGLAPVAGDRVLQFATLSFDVTVEEIFLTLLGGATLVLVSDPQVLDYAGFDQLARRQRLTSFELPTHYWSEWVADLDRRGATLPPTLRYVMTGTERALPERLNQWSRLRPGAAAVPLVHVYGLTETTVTSLTYRFVGGAPLAEGYRMPIGRPQANATLYLLDRHLSPLPPGVDGAIYLGGPGLARGYLGRPGFTAGRFVPDPFAGSPGTRLYRTGDLARANREGEVVFLGRIDTQVKVRGFRIEPGEIEAALAHHPTVAEAVVSLGAGANDERRLVAYLVLETGATAPTVTEWHRFLRRRLPEYMIPAAFVVLDAMPLTTRGKIDLRALPAPDGERPTLEASYIAPRGELERDIATIWRQVLGVDQVGIHDNFFELGGNSLLIAQVHARLREELDLDVSLVDLFTTPTIHALALANRGGEEGTVQNTEPLPAQASRRQSTEVAVIGWAGRFSGTRDLDEFWDHIRQGVDDVRRFTDEELIAAGVDPELVADPNFIGAKGVLPDADLFDSTFFDLPPREAEVIDPQHRIFLQLAWAALEQAGYDAQQTEQRIGVYAGCSPDYYYRENLFQNPAAESMDPLKVDFGNVSDFLPLRVSYMLDLEGPSINVQSACSTSLTAIAEAYFSLLDDQCDIALAGGVSVLVPQISGYLYHEDNIWSSDGHCRSFDAKADGLVTGEGAGIVVLKRLNEALADGDQVHAVIKGAAIRNEGAAKVGFAAPGVEGQVKMVRAALDMAGVEPDTIGLVEAHGSATNLGDPAEVTALTRAWRASTQGRGFCALGSVKSNIGHADIAAGVAGFLKAALALRHQVIPPSLHFESPNPQSDLENSPFYVPTELKAWERKNGTPRRAGVGSLGVGGTNTHVILEEAPNRPASGPSRPHHLLVLSAKTSTALARVAENLAAHLETHPDTPLADVAFTLAGGRRAMAHRRFVVAAGPQEALAALRSKTPRKVFSHQVAPQQEAPTLAFMLSGEGGQTHRAGADLYHHEDSFRTAVDHCCEILQPLLGLDLRAVLYPAEATAQAPPGELESPRLALPALFVVNYSIAKLWQSWGLQPQLLIGHGAAELVAACLAQILTLEDALRLITIRGRLLEDLPAASALAVSLPHEEVTPLLPDSLVIAEINGPFHCVVYGLAADLETLEDDLDDEQADHRRLSGRRAVATEATHRLFLEEVRKVQLRPPKVPLVSCLTGTWMTAEQAQSPDHWADHLLGVVRFSEGLQQILDRDHLALLEVGPGRTLTTLARQQVDRGRAPVLLTSLRRRREKVSDLAFALTSLGRLWLSGVPVPWPHLYAEEQRRRVSLPTYPFEEQRFWIEPPVRELLAPASSVSPALAKHPAMERWFYTPSWHRAPHPQRAARAQEGAPPWLLFLDPMGLGKHLAKELRALGHEVVTVQAGGGFAERDELHYVIHPGRRSDYETLFEELSEQGLSPGHLVHLWNVTPDESDIPGPERFAGGLESGYFSLLLLLQTLRSLRIAGDPHLMMVSNNMQEVHGSEALHPEKGTLLGICRVLSQEHPHLAASSFDVVLPPAKSPQTRLLAQQLIVECQRPARQLAVAWRGGSRWVQTFEAVELGPPLPSAPALRQGGVYLITGGQGYLGFELGALLARKYKARLALVGHSRLPPREDWDHWLEEHGDQDNKVCWKIGAVRRLEAAGAEVLLLTADAADPLAMAAAFDQTVAHFGALNGVLHAAGITDESHYHPIEETQPENCRLHFAPKIEGLCVLEELLREREVDFCLVFSSIASVLGGLGFVNYTAANAVLDTWVQRLNRLNTCHWVAVSWDGWLTTDELVEAAQESEEDSLLALAMTMEEGLEVTERILARRDLGHVVVSTGDLEQRIARWVRLDSLRDVEGPGQEEPTSGHSRPELSNAYEAPRNELEGEIAEIWQRLLGIDRVGIYDNFFEMGGDSLLAVHLSSKIHQGLAVEVTGGSLLAAQTVAEQAVLIVQKMAEEAGDEDLAEMLAGE